MTDKIGHTLSDQFENFASKYETVLPSKEALKKLLEEQMSEEKETL